MPKKHSDHIRNVVKMMVVQRHMDAAAISRELGGIPAAKTIERWMYKKATRGKNTGKTWIDLRDEQTTNEYELLTPENLAYRIMEDIKSLYNDPNLTPERRADALAKLYKPMERLLEPKLRVNALFATLKDFVDFLHQKHQALISDDLLKAVREYKDERLLNIVRPE